MRKLPLINKLSLRRIVPATIIALAPLPGLCVASDPLHPLGGVTLDLIIGRIIAVMLGLLGSISLAVFVWGGIIWMTASGNDEKIKKAKNVIVYAVFGLIMAFGSYAILRTFLNQVLFPALKRTT